jgi:hypothetical protein
MKTDSLSLPFAWAALIVATPFWIFAYTYLDAVMPNTYGVRRHPCFCCKSSKKQSYEDFTGLVDSE